VSMLTRPGFREVSRAVAGLMAGLMILAAQAQTTAESREGRIEEVIVTAQRRAENLQDVPIAVSALTADMAAKIGVDNGQTLAMAVPGLRLDRQTNGTIGFLRGVGQPSTQAGVEPAVAMYVDDVYYPSANVAIANYTSIERIEVLKGPQGTLFGRNATGGVIHVITKSPQQEPAFDVSVGYGNYQHVTSSLYATGGLSDTVAANFAGYYDEQYDGWGQNFTTGNDTYLMHDYGGRAKLLWSPSDWVDILFNVDYDNFFNQQAVYFRPAPGTTSNAGAVSIPPPDEYDTYENLDPKAAVEQYGGSIKVDVDFDPVKFVSISAYREDEATQLFAQDGANFPRLNPLLIYNQDTFTQEFQFLSPDGSKWQWVGGLFYLNDTVEIDPFQFTGFLPEAASGFQNVSSGATSKQDTESWSAFFQTTIPVTTALNLTAGVRYTADDRKITGARVNISSTGEEHSTEASNSGTSKTWNNTTFRVALDYQFTDDFMGYIAWNRGFKSGQYNTIIAPDFLNAVPGVPTIDPPVEPEEIDAYTLGFKSEFWDQRIRVNAEAFYYDYTNLQLQQVKLIPGGGTTTQITNAAAATMQGIDVDLTIIPVASLTLTLGMEYLDGQYDDYPNGQFFAYRAVPGGNCAFVAFNAGGCAAFPPHYDPATGNWNLKGNDTIVSPQITSTVTADYNVPMGGGGSLDLTASWYHSDEYFADADNGLGQVAPSSQSNDMQSALDIFNASVTWYSADDRWSVRLWGRNLSDVRYWSFANETGTIIKNVPAPPRTYGLTLMAHF
jgi:iron complex outermembrane recepter protein